MCEMQSSATNAHVLDSSSRAVDGVEKDDLSSVHADSERRTGLTRYPHKRGDDTQPGRRGQHDRGVEDSTTRR